MDSLGGWAPPSTGVTILEGLPGSGKSYRAVCWLYDAVRFDRRLIYTNLPLKFKVLRQLLRRTGGEHLTRYVVDLKKEHFWAAVARFAEITAFKEANKTLSEKDAEREWLDENGPHVPMPMTLPEWTKYRALDAVPTEVAEGEFQAYVDRGEIDSAGRLLPNWMEYGSAICVDEVHKWCDQRKQKDEDPRFLDFITMHRHGLFFVLMLTQDAMQTSITLRRNCVRYWRCQDMRNLAVFWGFKLPLPLFRYEEIAAGALPDQSSRTAAKPEKVWTEAPFLNGGLIWRLYRSFTHAGSARKLRKTIERTRQVAEGGNYDPRRTREKQMKVRHRQRWAMRVGFVLVAVMACGVSYFAAKVDASDVVPQLPGASSGSARPVQSSSPSTTRPMPRGDTSRASPGVSGAGEATQSPTLAAIGSQYVVVESQSVRIGQVVNGWKLVGTHAVEGYATFADRAGAMHDWYLGDERPDGVPGRGRSTSVVAATRPVTEADVRASFDEWSGRTRAGRSEHGERREGGGEAPSLPADATADGDD